MTDPDVQARQLAAESLGENDPTGWFERLYAAARDGEAVVPWDRGAPHPVLAEWVAERGLRGDGRRALVVGTGLGADAELVASLGFATTAFDISETAIATARRRFPHSGVDYRVADLLRLPPEWREAFDLVVEIMTVQSLPPGHHPAAIAAVAATVAAGGTLIVIGSAGAGAAAGGPPWPLTRAEVESFAGTGLETVRIDRLSGDAERWRAEFGRAR
jgi:threonine dehydrogenase-like Zn-dependent dehydrogenase